MTNTELDHVTGRGSGGAGMTRLRKAASMLRCFLFHEIKVRKYWVRCVTCRPVRTRAKKAKAATP